jgi:hypothetical protein
MDSTIILRCVGGWILLAAAFVLWMCAAGRLNRRESGARDE